MEDGLAGLGDEGLAGVAGLRGRARRSCSGPTKSSAAEGRCEDSPVVTCSRRRRRGDVHGGRARLPVVVRDNNCTANEQQKGVAVADCSLLAGKGRRDCLTSRTRVGFWSAAARNWSSSTARARRGPRRSIPAAATFPLSRIHLAVGSLDLIATGDLGSNSSGSLKRRDCCCSLLRRRERDDGDFEEEGD
ncbi:phenylalanine--tRNA ligase beta subunit [Striga asiatica]|uniref:Phenylalanine--tRNA ligase beta subunit n=1 Tax=Striga asiatica TaxID=4170 RepID=A0A5A7QMQ5_STRAF|nr:phenylalanine--tRNA ligase beta subunit [Striga asiatica]